MDRIIIVVAFILGCFSMLTWEYFKEVHDIRIYYASIAIEFTLIYYAYSLTQKGKFRVLCDAITSVCFAKLIDELFFDPTVFEWSEVVITIAGFLFLIGQKKLRNLYDGGNKKNVKGT